MFPKVVEQFFSLRGIDADTLARFEISWNGKEIVIPIKDKNGNVLFNKYRRSPDSNEGPKYRNEHGSTATLFNFNPDAKSVIITESELDAVLLCQLGYDACSSTNGSSSFPAEWIDMLKDKEVILCYDADQPGTKGAVKIANLFPIESNIKLIAFPEYWKGKDVTEYIQKYGAEKFKKLLEKSISLPRNEDVQKAINETGEVVKRKAKADGLSTLIIDQHLSTLNNVKANANRKKIKQEKDEVFTHVKEVPMTRFIEFNGEEKANCIFHSEKTPSMKYYPKNNTFYCFGCAKSGDVITVVQQLNNCTFPQALEILKTHL